MLTDAVRIFQTGHWQAIGTEADLPSSRRDSMWWFSHPTYNGLRQEARRSIEGGRKGKGGKNEAPRAQPTAHVAGSSRKHPDDWAHSLPMPLLSHTQFRGPHPLAPVNSTRERKQGTLVEDENKKRETEQKPGKARHDERTKSTLCVSCQRTRRISPTVPTRKVSHTSRPRK